MKKTITTILMGFIFLASSTSFAFDGIKTNQNKEVESLLKTTAVSPASSYIYSLGDNGDSTILISMLTEIIKQTAISQQQLMATQRTNQLLETMLGE